MAESPKKVTAEERAYQQRLAFNQAVIDAEKTPSDIAAAKLDLAQKRLAEATRRRAAFDVANPAPPPKKTPWALIAGACAAVGVIAYVGWKKWGR